MDIYENSPFGVCVPIHVKELVNLCYFACVMWRSSKVVCSVCVHQMFSRLAFYPT